nr:cuticle protein CP1876-like [Cherax quadricarinatus]
MRTLVILAVLGVCSAVPSIGDTPEVAAEKARFFQAFRAAEASAKPHYNAHQQAHNTGHYNPHQYNHGKYNPGHYHQPKWTGPVAATIPAGVDGTITPVSDTRDVSAARNAFFNAYQSHLLPCRLHATCFKGLHATFFKGLHATCSNAPTPPGLRMHATWFKAARHLF